MANKKVTRRALTMSIISLILCCAMLVGTTFAWFTDEVVTGMNTIEAGNLDIELLANGTKVDSNTKLFDDVTLWEPGVVVYENLQIANVGTLALKYQMTLKFGNENDLNGHKLSEVLKVAVIDKIADGATRQDVLAAAKASTNVGTLSNFLVRGDLEAEDKSTEQTVVIFWEPNDNAKDNLYNANNEQVTSDGLPLHIEFGINLQATQKMSEEDSFGNDYDEFAGFKPIANVNGSTELTVPVTGIDGYDEITLDTAYQFKPTETYEQAQSSPYRYYHADFVVSADKDVPANSMALAGYYSLYCDTQTGGDWVALTSSDVITAGTEIRLVDSMGVSVNYEELCNFGNDGIGFKCGAADLTDENAGTTITVELRLYETTKDPNATSGTANEEVLDENGNPVYVTVGTYSYTFGGSWTTLSDGTELFYENDGSVTLYDTQNVDAVDYAVPAGVTHLGNYSLSYNKTIQTVTLPTSVKDLGRAFDSNGTIKKVVLNEGLETISSRAFRSTTALEEVVISSTVATIADNAFQKSGIKEIVIPANVKTIGETAFGASMIKTVTIEGNTNIEGYAFRGCTELTTVYLNGDDVNFVASSLNGRNSTWFCNSESNNPNTSNITFHVKNEIVAAKVKTAMGAEAANTPVYVNGVLYEG